jgi:hypothetical protein
MIYDDLMPGDILFPMSDVPWLIIRKGPTETKEVIKIQYLNLINGNYRDIVTATHTPFLRSCPLLRRGEIINQ